MIYMYDQGSHHIMAQPTYVFNSNSPLFVSQMTFTILENLRGFFNSRPPLVVFMICLGSFAISLILFAHLVKSREIPDPDVNEVSCYCINNLQSGFRLWIMDMQLHVLEIKFRFKYFIPVFGMSCNLQ